VSLGDEGQSCSPLYAIFWLRRARRRTVPVSQTLDSGTLGQLTWLFPTGHGAIWSLEAGLERSIPRALSAASSRSAKAISLRE
jgi:hypothetical protein